MTVYRLTMPHGVSHPCRGVWRRDDAPTVDYFLDELIPLDARAVLVVISPDGVTLDTDPDGPPHYSPDVDASDTTDPDGQHTDATDPDVIAQARRQGWELVTGHTGQHGYSGPMFHASEYIGGGLADLIAGADDDTPRRTLWAASYVSEADGESSSWVLAYRELS